MTARTSRSAASAHRAFLFGEHAVQIEMMPTERLVPYARNARTHSEAQVAGAVSNRHDKVKLPIERLSDQGVIGLTPMREH